MHGVEERQFFFSFFLSFYFTSLQGEYETLIFILDPFHRIRNSILNGSRRGFIKTSIIPTFRIPLKSKRSGEFNATKFPWISLYYFNLFTIGTTYNVARYRESSIELSPPIISRRFFDLKKDDSFRPFSCNNYARLVIVSLSYASSPITINGRGVSRGWRDT